ncbi:FAD:protein FMN transferase [Desulforhopalus singaporensis]|nr:FAD:protein FMN transferase [Desulforhopalus singaporensis]
MAENNTTKNVNRRTFFRIIGVAGASAVCWKMGLFSNQATLHRVSRSQPLMGTVLNLTLYGPDREQCEEALSRTAATMQSLEARFSRHIKTSELAQLNRHGLLHSPTEDLKKVLQMATDLSIKSSGAFDVTMLPLLQLREQGAGLQSPDRDKYNRLIGFDKVHIGSDVIRLDHDKMAVTLDGIGKGYIVDRGVESLKRSGFANVYVEAGGDLMVTGLKQDKAPWRIGIQNPRPQNHKGKLMTVIEVSDKAVATSGDYMQAFATDFTQHHIIDPRSWSSPPELASVTVTAPTVALADGLSTAVMVLGPDLGKELIEQSDGCEAYMVGKDLKEYTTTGFFS